MTGMPVAFSPSRRYSGVRSLAAIAAPLLLLSVLLLEACSKPFGPGKQFAPFENAAVAAGRGFAELPLGSALADVAARLGAPDQVAAVAGDQYYAEMLYHAPGVTLRFDILPDCVNALQSAGRVAEGLMRLRKPESFFADFPACKASPLQSMALGMGQKPDDAFYKGATEQGVRIGSDKEQALRAYGGSQDVRSASLAGSSPDDSNYDELIYSNGLALYLGPAGGGQSWQVHRIVVFAPPAGTAPGPPRRGSATRRSAGAVRSRGPSCPPCRAMSPRCSARRSSRRSAEGGSTSDRPCRVRPARCCR